MARFNSDLPPVPGDKLPYDPQELASAVDSVKVVQTQSDAAFDFVRILAAELSRGHVDLPSFPEIAIKVRRVLEDADTSADKVVRVVGSEPALSGQLLRIANSASMNRSGRPVTDLRTAVNRIGHNMVRSAAMSFSMNQIRNSNKLTAVAPHLKDLWERSTYVAAYAYVLARECSRVNPDEAMLAGMMHGIGKLYILTRAVAHPELFTNETALNDIISEWYPSIGKAILENWGFPEAMARAVGQEDTSRNDVHAADLTDVVAAALVMVSSGTDIAGLEVELGEMPAAKRLGLNESKTHAVMQDSAAEVTALSQALAG